MIARQRSAQPVWVDGVSVDKAPLRGGETIRIGDFAIVFRLQDAVAAAREEDETVRLHPAVAPSAVQPTAALIFLAGGPSSGRVALVRGVTVFGRGEECDVVLDDQLCSRRHAELQRVGAVFVLRDLDSTNGVSVNGQRLDAEVELRDGDVIQMGGATMRLAFTADAESGADPAAAAAAAVIAGSSGAPPAASGLLGRWSRISPVAQVGTAFAVAVLIAATFYIATASSRRSAKESQSIAMRRPDRDPKREPRTSKEEAASPREMLTGDDVSDPEPSADEDATDDSEAPEAESPRATSPESASAGSAGATGRSPARRSSDDEEDDADWSDEAAADGKPPRAFANLLETEEQEPKSSDRPRASSSRPDPQEDSESTTSNESPPVRLAVPAEADVAEASESVRSVFAEELSGPEDLAPTVAKLLGAARRSTKPASKFALLLAAERKAVQASAFRRACEVIDARAEMFEIDALQSRLNMLRDAAKAAGETKDEIFDIVVEVTEESLEAERFDVASKAAALAGVVAAAIEQHQQGKAPGRRIEAARQLKQTVAETKKFHQKYEQARETLRETPEDAKALEVVGKYLCFVKGDWSDGLRALAAGRETALQDLAAREVALPAGREADTMAVFSLAGDWWAFAENSKRSGDLPTGSGDLLKMHAAGIYERIVGRLEDPIDAELAKKRIAAAEPSE